MTKRVRKTIKNKATGVILAVFFGFFAWIYTWKFDKSKFWVALIVNIFLWWTIIVPIASWVWAVVNMSVKDKDKYVNYYKWKIK